MYQKFLFLAGLVLAATAQAQMPDRTIMRHIALAYAIAETPSGTTTGWADPTPILRVNSERALLGQLEDRSNPRGPASFTGAPIDGSRALLGNSPSDLTVGARGGERQSSFRAEVRGNVAGNASGEAEFGTVYAVDQSTAAFVVSLGVCGEQSAILFTRRNGAPLDVGRYRISAGADGVNEILALVMTGSPTRPTGVFRGESGWLVVTAASDQFIAGQFEVDATGFTAAESQDENRQVNVSGSFLATTGSSSFRVCEDVK
jgi:hypothetical protein